MGASLPYNHWDYGRYTPWQVVKMWARMCGWMNGFDPSIHPRSPVSSIFKVGTPFNKSPIHSCLQERPWKVRGRSFLHKFLTIHVCSILRFLEIPYAWRIYPQRPTMIYFHVDIFARQLHNIIHLPDRRQPASVPIRYQSYLRKSAHI